LDQDVENDREREEILEEIQKLVTTRRIDTSSEKLEMKKVKLGMWFPLSVNLLSLGLLAAGFFGARWYFDQRAEEIRTQSAQQFSLEGRLITKLLEESQKKIEEQQAEIDKIQGDLSRLTEEKDQLAGQYETQLKNREEQLKQELSQELATERARLSQQGVSQAEIDRRLKEFEDRKNSELNQNLERLRQEAQAELAQREAQLSVLQNQLSTAQSTQDAARREAEARNEGKISNLETQLTEQAAYLERLSDERSTDQELFQRLEAGLDLVKTGLGTSGAEALTALDSLDRTLASSLEGATENLARRIRTFQAASGAIRSALGKISVQEVGQVVANDPSLDRLKELVLRAREQPAQRRDILAEAVGLISEVSEAVQGIRALDQADRTREKVQQEAAYLELVRTAVQDFSTLGPEKGWERLFEAIAPANAAEAQIELREGVARALEASLNTTRLPAEEVEKELKAEIERLNALNETGTKALETAQTRITELETTLKDLDEQLAALKQQPPTIASDETSALRIRELETSVSELKTELKTLEEYKAKTLRLSEGWKSAVAQTRQSLPGAPNVSRINAVRDMLAESMEREDGVTLFPDFRSILGELSEAQEAIALKPGDVVRARAAALTDVLKLTSYLEGTSGRGDQLSTEIRNLSSTDDNFKTVVESVQRLSIRGAQETPVQTAAFQLLGPVISAVGTRVNAEILTSPEKVGVGLNIEIRRPTDQTQVLAKGVLTEINGRRVVIQISENTSGMRLPIGGDIVFVQVQ